MTKEAYKEEDMRLVSVNVSMPKTVEHLGRKVSTAIFKRPVNGRVMVRKLNADGDGQADLTVHGGVYKAVYAYALENISYWRQVLDREDITAGGRRGARV
jgi:MOSC domain-containing protein YiiM